MDGIRKTNVITNVPASSQGASSQMYARSNVDAELPDGGTYGEQAREEYRESSDRFPSRGELAVRKRFRALLLALVAIGALGVALYFLYRPRVESRVNAEPVREETAKLIARVGTHVVLPEGEEPTVATITDAAPLRNQAFYARARVGDAVLFYPRARIAVLYDPRLDRVINMAPLAEGDAALVMGATSTPSTNPR